MHQQEIKQELDGFIRSELLCNRRSEPIGTDEELLETGLIDSIGFFKMLGFITERFGVTHDDSELVPDNFHTIGVISRRVTEKMNNQTKEGRG